MLTNDVESADLAGARRLPVRRLRAGLLTSGDDWVAEETPVALVYNGVSHAVMMATPTDLTDFALGFSLNEGILDSPDEMLDLDLEAGPAGISVQISITARRLVRLQERRRTLAGRTGCGLCGIESLHEAIRPLAPVADGLQVRAAAIGAALHALAEQQPLNRCTGATHAAGWCDGAGRLLLVREDVGRHNALDKLIGALARAGCGDPGDGTADPAITAPAGGFAVVTSRASFEMVHKCASAGIGLLAAISAPTRLAIDVAERTNLTLIGYARDDRLTVYHGGHRLDA